MEIATTSAYVIEAGLRPGGANPSAPAAESQPAATPDAGQKPTEENPSRASRDEPLSSSLNIRDYVRQNTERAKQGDELPASTKSSEQTPGNRELTPEELEQVEKLKARDREVRQHEQAHLAAAGGLANGGIQYEYQTGPDGKQYAIGGHVNLDTSSENTPEATLAKAQQVQRAALAPADPSPQDVKVAAQATQMILEAQRELATESEADEDGAKESAVQVQSTNAEQPIASRLASQ